MAPFPRALVLSACLAACTGAGQQAQRESVAQVVDAKAALAMLLLAEAMAEEEAARAAAEQEAKPEREPDVIYVPTPPAVVDKMLELAEIKEGDVVYDLGCGDGRIVIAAAERYGVKAWGFDIDPERVAEARENAEAAGVEHLVTIEEKDIFTVDLSAASVVMLYLLPELNVRLIPQLEKLRPGSRIVSHDFDMKGVTPVEHLSLQVPPSGTEHQVYLWRTPLFEEPDAQEPDAQEPDAQEPDAQEPDAQEPATFISE